MPQAPPPSRVAHLPLRRVCLGGLLEDVDIHHQLADLALQARDLLVFEDLIVQRPAVQGVLGTT